MGGFEAESDGVYYIYSDGVPSLFISLGIGIHREEAVNLGLRKALQAEAFPRHQPADAQLRRDHALAAAGIQRVGDLFPNAPPAGVHPGET